MKRTLLVATLGAFMSLMTVASAQAGIVLTAEAPGVQTTQVAGTTTENFNSFATGNYTTLTTAVGTITSPGLNIHSADVYGGAGGSGNYAAIGAQSGTLTATLTLQGPQSYFGFWWSAADAGNRIEFLSNGVEVAYFDPTSALGSLTSSNYYGNPNNRGDSGEKFAYLNVYGTAGTTFNQVIFSNTTTGSGFESDNWAVRAAAVTPPYSGMTISGGISVVPEPSSIVLAAIGAVGMVGVTRKKRQSA